MVYNNNNNDENILNIIFNVRKNWIKLIIIIIIYYTKIFKCIDALF